VVALVAVVAAPTLQAGATAAVFLNVAERHPERPANLPGYEVVQTAPQNPSKFRSVEAHVNGLSWSSWGGDTATGTGSLEVRSSDTRPGHVQPYASQTAPVSIMASHPVPCGGQLVYSHFTLTPLPGASEPRDFAEVQTRQLPCHVQALGYYAGIEAVANTTGDCLFKGVANALPSGFGYLGYCRMEWKQWGQASTVGTGIGRAVTLPSGCDGRHSECDYGIRVRLGTPAWCPAYGMSYTRERLEIFGSGVVTDSEPRAVEIAPSVEHRLLATIGHAKPHLYFQQASKAQGCEM
jgi:hypothetical protein